VAHTVDPKTECHERLGYIICIFLNTCASAFEAEMVAIDAAISFLVEVRRASNSRSQKRKLDFINI